MLQPYEMTLSLPMEVANGVMSTTTDVWNILVASFQGDLHRVQEMAKQCPELLYAQYNYAPPIHFAVREGHVELVHYLLCEGALDPTYKIYPFLDPLLAIAEDREHHEITGMLKAYLDDPSLCKFHGDNGRIFYNRSADQQAFENAVDHGDEDTVKKILDVHPEYVHDPTFFWAEGILMMPAKDNNRSMVKLLMQYGALVPAMSKWCRFYYFENYDMAAFLLENGMSANHISWQHVTLLHDMAQEGNLQKAALLLRHGAAIDALDEQYHSTPLGLAAKWGRVEMVEFLLQQGADPNKAGAHWATPLQWAQKKAQTEIEAILLRAGATR